MQSLHRRTTALLQQVYVYIAIVITIVGMSLPVTVWAAAEEDQDNSALHVTPATEAGLSVNDPIYFVVGGRGDTRMRFQFSFTLIRIGLAIVR